MERGLFWHFFGAAKQLLGARPTDFDAAEQISLGAGHLENPLGAEKRFTPEDVRIGPETDFGAASVRRFAGILQFGLWLAALERHAVEPLAARNLDFHAFGERIRHRHADAVQSA